MFRDRLGAAGRVVDRACDQLTAADTLEPAQRKHHWCVVDEPLLVEDVRGADGRQIWRQLGHRCGAVVSFQGRKLLSLLGKQFEGCLGEGCA